MGSATEQRQGPTTHMAWGAGGSGQDVAGRGGSSAATAGTTARRGRARSVAWMYYAVLAVLSVVSAVISGSPTPLVGLVLFGLYATYLYRGGSIVIWFW